MIADRREHAAHLMIAALGHGQHRPRVGDNAPAPPAAAACPRPPASGRRRRRSPPRRRAGPVERHAIALGHLGAWARSPDAAARRRRSAAAGPRSPCRAARWSRAPDRACASGPAAGIDQRPRLLVRTGDAERLVQHQRRAGRRVERPRRSTSCAAAGPPMSAMCWSDPRATASPSSITRLGGRASLHLAPRAIAEIGQQPVEADCRVTSRASIDLVAAGFRATGRPS